MPRGRLPTGTVAMTSFVGTARTDTSPDASLLTNKRGPCHATEAPSVEGAGATAGLANDPPSALARLATGERLHAAKRQADRSRDATLRELIGDGTYRCNVGRSTVLERRGFLGPIVRGTGNDGRISVFLALV